MQTCILGISCDICYLAFQSLSRNSLLFTELLSFANVCLPESQAEHLTFVIGTAHLLSGGKSFPEGEWGMTDDL